MAATTTTASTDQKELKFRLKTHTRYEIATTIIKHAQIHFSMPLPNMCMAAMSVSSSVFYNERRRKKKCFFRVFFVVSRRNIYVHNWTVLSCCCFCCCRFSTSTILSMVGWFLMDSFIWCSPFFLIHCVFLFCSIHKLLFSHSLCVCLSFSFFLYVFFC